MNKIYLIKSNTFNFFAVIVGVLVTLFVAQSAFAHRVVIFAWIEGDTVYTESRFPDGKQIPNAIIKVYDMQKTLLLDGKTNDNGEFSFKIPKISGLNIVLEAGMGHQGDWNISENEITSAMGIPAENPPAGADSSQNEMAGSSASVEAPDSGDAGISLNEKQLNRIVEKAVEKALDKKLQPIARTLARMQDIGPEVNDIFGGIGYILGLMGVAAYFLSKKKN